MSIAIEPVPTSPGILDTGSTRYAAAATVLAVGLSVVSIGGIPVPSLGQILLLTVMTAVIGIPHGGLDHQVGCAVCRPWAGRWWPFVFGAAYVSVAALVLAGWVFMPLTTITVFFLMSAIHFGDGGPLASAAIEGGMVIWVPFLARPEEGIRLLASVTPGRLAESIQGLAVALKLLLWILALFLAGRIIWLAWSGAREWSSGTTLEALRLTSFAGLFATAPVLLSFAAFFCGWHSVRELAQLAVRANPSRPFRGLVRVIMLSAPLTAVVVLATALAAWRQFAGGRPAELVVVQAVFLALSAVAVPHIILHAIARRLHVDPFASGPNS